MSRFKYMGIASKWRFFLFVVLMVEYLRSMGARIENKQ